MKGSSNHTISLKELALDLAIEQIGQRELSKNSGPMVDKYLASVNLRPGYAWCQAFVFWCFDIASKRLGIFTPVVKTGGVLHCWNNTLGGKKLTKNVCIASPNLIKPGDQFVMDFGGGLGHTGIVESVDGYTLHTIEGNSNKKGSREGIMVCRNTRSIEDKLFKGIIQY